MESPVLRDNAEMLYFMPDSGNRERRAILPYFQSRVKPNVDELCGDFVRKLQPLSWHPDGNMLVPAKRK